jgi:non-canonical purine NTP pyrophosphatase (RdgB/HAM1 family)
MRLVLATTNHGKVREMRQILSGAELELDDLTTFLHLPVPDETGATFQANACLKASHYARGLEAWTLADDSGLAVDALGGKPGVHSARWAAMHASGSGDSDNNALLLQQLKEIPDAQRSARFVCCLALANPAGHIVLTATAWVAGRILHAPRGDGGFGYDPLFMIESLGRTTAQLPPSEKNAISHRGKATRRMGELMFKHLLSSDLNPACRL